MDYSDKDVSRFLEKVPKLEKDVCWNWMGPILQGKGYGRFWLGKKTIGAHVFSLFLHTGIDPGKLFTLHSCDNPQCVNPHHLRLGTGADNLREMAQKGRAAKGLKHGTKTKPDSVPRLEANPCPSSPKRRYCGSRHHKSKLHAENIKYIFEQYSLKEKNQSELAREFGVSQTAIWLILKGKNWKCAARG